VIGFSVVLTVLGLIASAMLGVPALLLAVGVGVVGFLYNWRFKRTGLLGNGMVSFSVGMTFVFDGVAVGRPFQRLVWFFAVIGMLIDLGEEIAADALDMEGDRAMGSRSLAVMDLGILMGTTWLVASRETAARRRYVRWIYLSGLVGMLVFLVVRMVVGS
jgi:geranylgeranylglycerol-phosphate geranylgeranyltransferase